MPALLDKNGVLLDPDKNGVLLDPSTIRFERLLPGPIERIWAYLTQSEKRKQWFAAGEYELHDGGKAHLVFQHKHISKPGTEPPEQFRKMHDEGHHWDGEILKVDAPRLLTMTFGEHSEVTNELTEQASGEVLLTLTHRKLTANDLAHRKRSRERRAGLARTSRAPRRPAQQSHRHRFLGAMAGTAPALRRKAREVSNLTGSL